MKLITFCLNVCTRTSEGNDSSFRSKTALEAEIKFYVMRQSLFFMPQTKENNFLIVSVGMGDTAVVPKLIILCVCE